jgi:DNA-binding FrmR family transcriptional regulator
VAAAQRLAAELARRQEDFADKLAQSENKGGGIGDMPPKDETKAPGINPDAEGKPDEKMAGLGGAAEMIAEKAETLADVLAGAAKATTPEEQDAAKKVEELINGMGIGELTERLKNLPGQVGAGKMADAKATAGDGSDRLAAAAEALAALHRAIVAPRVDELAKVEEKLSGLDEQLDELETQSKITGWHMEAQEILDELDKAGVPPEDREEFLAEMKKAGWGTNRGKWNWTRAEGGNYAAPARYRPLLARVLANVRGRMQELLLGDLTASGDEPIPPQYQEFVDRYQQVLTTEGKSVKQPVIPSSEAAAP